MDSFVIQRFKFSSLWNAVYKICYNAPEVTIKNLFFFFNKNIIFRKYTKSAVDECIYELQKKSIKNFY